MLKELVKHFFVCMCLCVLEKLSHPEGKWFKSEMKGASYSSLMTGMVLGFSYHPQTILNYEKTLAEANKTEVQKQI